MTGEVVSQITEEAERLRATGAVPPGLEEELDTLFEDVAEASLAAAGDALTSGAPAEAPGEPPKLTRSGKHATILARRRLGPPLRRLESRAVLGTTRAGEVLSTQAHAAADRLERLAASSRLASRALTIARPGEPIASAGAEIQPAMDEPLLGWVLERLVGACEDSGPPEAPRSCCTSSPVTDAWLRSSWLGGTTLRGADPHLSARAVGDTTVVAAGALEYLSATPSATLDGVLLTGVVDRLRPGAARALAHLVARRLAPGGVVVLVQSLAQKRWS